MRLSRLMLALHDFPVFLCSTTFPVLLFMLPLFAPVGDVLSSIFCCIAGGLRTAEHRESWGEQRGRDAESRSQEQQEPDAFCRARDQLCQRARHAGFERIKVDNSSLYIIGILQAFSEGYT